MKKICNNCGYPLEGNEKSCPECGEPILHEQATQSPQPQKVDSQPQSSAGSRQNAQMVESAPIQSSAESCQSAQTVEDPPVQSSSPAPAHKIDWANYIYECGVIAWRTLSTKYAQFSGRASRREFWSFAVLGIAIWWSFMRIVNFLLDGLFYLMLSSADSIDTVEGFLNLFVVLKIILALTLIIPLFGVMVRRLHDINRSGGGFLLWFVMPIVPFLMSLKKSDEGPNDYGDPEPASDLI